MTERDDRGRRDAERISRDQRHMHAVLSAVARQVSDRLPATSPEHAAPPEHAVPLEHVAPVGRRPAWRRWTVAPLAAAAAVAALLLLPNGAIEEGGGPLTSPTRSMVSDMDVEADRPFVVFPTNDPDIAVVWLLNPEESD